MTAFDHLRHLTRYNTIRYDMIRHDTIQYNTMHCCLFKPRVICGPTNDSLRPSPPPDTIRYNTVTNVIRTGWNRPRKMSGVIRDKKVPEALKYKIYKTAIRPTMTYGGNVGR